MLYPRRGREKDQRKRVWQHEQCGGPAGQTGGRQVRAHHQAGQPRQEDGHPGYGPRGRQDRQVQDGEQDCPDRFKGKL